VVALPLAAPDRSCSAKSKSPPRSLVLREGFAYYLLGLSRSLPTTLRCRYGTRTRALRSGTTSRRGRGRSACRPAAVTWGTLLLVILALAVPVIVAANPVDPTWVPGVYDDADPDQLVSQALSPESWLSAALPVILCLLTTIAPVWLSRQGRSGADRSEQVARAPPGLAGTSTTRIFSIDPRCTERPPRSPDPPTFIVLAAVSPCLYVRELTRQTLRKASRGRRRRFFRARHLARQGPRRTNASRAWSVSPSNL
jgi:hypothetical protein